MSEWITYRKPTANDADNGFVWVTTVNKVVLRQAWECVKDRPWQPIVPPEPYVKPKRWQVGASEAGWQVFDSVHLHGYVNARCIPTREAAERIAAIYEEVMP